MGRTHPCLLRFFPSHFGRLRVEFLIAGSSRLRIRTGFRKHRVPPRALLRRTITLTGTVDQNTKEFEQPRKTLPQHVGRRRAKVRQCVFRRHFEPRVCRVKLPYRVLASFSPTSPRSIAPLPVYGFRMQCWSSLLSLLLSWAHLPMSFCPPTSCPLKRRPVLAMNNSGHVCRLNTHHRSFVLQTTLTDAVDRDAKVSRAIWETLSPRKEMG